MFESRCRKKDNLSWCLLLLLALSVSGCGIDSKYTFLYTFPISGFTIGGFPILDTFAWKRMGTELITGPQRVFYSIVVYAILLSVLATIPLYIKKSFENKATLQYYVVYWLLASMIFATLFLSLHGIVPNDYSNKKEYVYFMFLLSADVLLPALIPAFYQHFKKN